MTAKELNDLSIKDSVFIFLRHELMKHGYRIMDWNIPYHMRVQTENCTNVCNIYLRDTDIKITTISPMSEVSEKLESKDHMFSYVTYFDYACVSDTIDIILITLEDYINYR